jgi:hypothetical protein
MQVFKATSANHFIRYLFAIEGVLKAMFFGPPYPTLRLFSNRINT